ncbi:MAG: hypothetical protein R6V04_09615 [bacterium]
MYIALIQQPCTTDREINLEKGLTAITKAAYQGNTFFIYKYVNPDILYEVDMKGEVVWKLELPDSMGSNQTEAKLLPDNTGTPVETITNISNSPHDPQILDNGNLLVAQQNSDYHAAVELDRQTNVFIWEFGFTSKDDFPVCDANLLPN